MSLNLILKINTPQKYEARIREQIDESLALIELTCQSTSIKTVEFRGWKHKKPIEVSEDGWWIKVKRFFRGPNYATKT